MHTPSKNIAIILLNWNNSLHTISCLTSLMGSTDKLFYAIILDNGSNNESINELKSWASGELKAPTKFTAKEFDDKMVDLKERAVFPQLKWDVQDRNNDLSKMSIILLKNAQNDGFAKGNNIAIEFTFTNPEIEYIFLLNNDTEIDSQCLAELRKFALSNPTIGCLQPKMLYHSDSSFINCVGIGINLSGSGFQVGLNTKDYGQFNRVARVFGACAGAAFYRTDLLKDVGLLDEDFFLNQEDVDLSIRTVLKGWKTYYIPTAFLYHKQSVTTGTSNPQMIYFMIRNSYFYFIKNYSVSLLIKFVVKKLIKYAFLGGYYCLTFKWGHFKTIVKAHCDTIKSIPTLLRKRAIIQRSKKIDKDSLKKLFTPRGQCPLFFDDNNPNKT